MLRQPVCESDCKERCMVVLHVLKFDVATSIHLTHDIKQRISSRLTIYFPSVKENK